MKIQFENIHGFNVLHLDGGHTWGEASRELPWHVQGSNGIDDWVLPDHLTLVALRSLSSGATDLHWSSTPNFVDSGYAWAVNFGFGEIISRQVSSCCFLRVSLVRASQCLEICIAAAKKSMEEAGIKYRLPQTQGETT